MTHTRLYPGMLDSSKEYFNSGPNVMMIHNGSIKNFDDVSHHPELAQIISEEEDLQNILHHWFPENQLMQQKTLAKCRFGALNFFADINDDEITHDHSHCPFRGKCAGEYIVCKPAEINGASVTIEEITILQEVCGDDTNINIAKKLGYPLGTFHVKKTGLYEKLGLNNKQHAVFTLLFEGLL
ncbi:LuxR C-terminal-related transcriptional regulator [Chryseobacterium sp. MP_3.2]|uniref:LuxR C-terminal-related transcriptional regulator n=1 Tax=Chryseobacterium sp. MP_3.2 TaxID=3071712 RepID=UPI002E0778C5|nr:DNA-binding CsgD family transcriptional regulator [Chryseobacterium sp. MP_3.2]